MSIRHILLLAAGSILATGAQAALFNFDNANQYTPLPLDQTDAGVVAHFTGAYSVQNISQVIGMSPDGFNGLGLSPNSVFLADLAVSFTNQSNGLPALLDSATILVAPQELACDSSSTMRISAYRGANLVGTQTAIAPELDTYLWPTITLGITPGQMFDNIVVHFEKAPPTGGDYGVIFVADNLSVNAVPEPATYAGVAVMALAVIRSRRK